MSASVPAQHADPGIDEPGDLGVLRAQPVGVEAAGVARGRASDR